MTTASVGMYSAFGLTVHSDLELPELPRSERPTSEAADVEIRFGDLDRSRTTDNGTVEYVTADEYYLTYEVAEVRIRDGREIVVDPSPDAPHEVLRHVVLGPVFNHLLHQRGHFVLHASVVDIGGTAVAFLGESGQGKTTTAMAFLLEGYRVLSDDVATIDFGADGATVRSGYPAIKLDPTVVDRFDVPVSEPQRISASRDRHFYGLPYQQPAEPTPLERIYVLSDADRIEISRPGAEVQIMQLIENTYTAGLLRDDTTAVSNFRQCARLAEQVELKHLGRPRDLELLPRLVERVREDLEDPC